MPNLIQPKVVRKTSQSEVWLFRGQYFHAFLFSDGVCQLRTCDAEGRAVGMAAINSHNMHNREDAIRWLNENVG